MDKKWVENICMHKRGLFCPLNFYSENAEIPYFEGQNERYLGNSRNTIM